MSVLGSVLDVITGGGATGLISGAVGAYTKIQEMKLANEHRRFEMKYEIQMHKLQFQSDKYMADSKLLISKQEGEDLILNSAIQAEGKIDDTGLPWLVRAARTLFRPFLTIFLWVGALWMAFSGVPATSITQGVALAFQHGASATTGFWFGSRAVGNEPNR